MTPRARATPEGAPAARLVPASGRSDPPAAAAARAERPEYRLGRRHRGLCSRLGPSDGFRDGAFGLSGEPSVR